MSLVSRKKTIFAVDNIYSLIKKYHYEEFKIHRSCIICNYGPFRM